ncbi:5'-methylthioadenosine/S-adenosylhomocysteine nucleosidase [Subtercola sp. PAMC28395]|uniref:5'-methylthioadenosine/S-adenosylhomocysteine nucleosidase family protein n=1 Tax=Subtercola sp. PAMC28395 TaxID=2846775 RepID=UPI001C0DB5BA|nr:5'-methylthioadenosine/S-adenosylhomocysteine nucleosidase [Subtercola sp. PAMC28395]QWT24511.1 5'-methylthioadenosine/S-adenosylhomocysteine nucleosidase [Subtercola sp. PAMC28395]
MTAGIPRAIVIVAMDDEAAPFIERATAVGEPRSVGNAMIREITFAGLPVLLVRSGIGLVNAAGAATAAILATAQDRASSLPMVISAGTAGGVDESVAVGDVVIGGTYINIDADARAFGYELGQVPGMPPFYTASSEHLDALADGSWMPDLSVANLPAVTTPLGAADSGTLSTGSVPSGTASRGTVPSTIHVGLIVSSYSFVSEPRALVIRDQFSGALATDMESVAIAQTSFVHDRPFLSVRGISDLCGPVANADFLTHVDDAADRSAQVIAALLQRLLAPGY